MLFAKEVGPKLNPQFLQSVLDHFNKGKLLHWNPFMSGWTNITVHMQTTEGDFILRIYQSGIRTRKEIDLEIETIEYLVRQGIPVAAPNKNNDGKAVLTTTLGDKKLTVALFDFVSGASKPHPIAREINVMGQMLSAIHQALTDFTGSHSKKVFRFGRELAQIDTRINRHLSGRWAYGRIISAAELQEMWHRDLKYLRKLGKKLSPELNQRFLIHGDFHPGNLKFAGKGISGVFDFDNLMHASRVLDLAIALAQFKYWHAELNPNDLSSVSKHLLGGYQSKIKLSTRELELMWGLTLMWLWRQASWTVKFPHSGSQKSHHQYFLEASLAGIRELEALR
jgi:homoserine kinase type II